MSYHRFIELIDLLGKYDVKNSSDAREVKILTSTTTTVEEESNNDIVIQCKLLLSWFGVHILCMLYYS